MKFKIPGSKQYTIEDILPVNLLTLIKPSSPTSQFAEEKANQGRSVTAHVRNAAKQRRSATTLSGIESKQQQSAAAHFRSAIALFPRFEMLASSTISS
ncbi:uncharacterized protein G2W53_044537 [Senna tora]|uniref:Uncharacterized protein n=1 Tax=Senna tora TaxID=362788 RepID=A0A834SES3_9FABA|nr:uncharacterized protein G2W53_044537 [Senna tora]